MSIALLTHTAKDHDVSGVTTDAIDTTGADFIVMMTARYGGLDADLIISDSKGNTWTPLTVVDDANGNHGRIYYCVAPIVGTGHTFTATNRYGTIAVACFSGVKQSSPFDQENGIGFSTSTSKATGTVTPSENNELVIFGCITDAGINITVDIGTMLNAYNYTGSFSIALGYQIQTTAAARNPTFSWTTSSGGCVAAATFKIAPAGPSVAVATGSFSILDC